MKTLLRLLVVSALGAMSATAWGANFRTVVIDAGHGGHDNGGQWGRVYEKHLALDTAARLEKQLKRMGFKTVMTRNSDYFVSLPGRVAIGNSCKDAIFVSIHFNYTWKENVCGLETYYYGFEGQKLANNVQRNLIRQTRTIDRSAKFARFYVIRNSTLPAILVEGGFVTNEQERERMKSGDFREAIARGIAEGILRYNRAG